LTKKRLYKLAESYALLGTAVPGFTVMVFKAGHAILDRLVTSASTARMIPHTLDQGRSTVQMSDQGRSTDVSQHISWGFRRCPCWVSLYGCAEEQV
jgi:hypothetical protein